MCPLFRGCLNIEVNGKTVGTFRIVRYIVDVRFSGVSVKQGSTVCASSLHVALAYQINQPIFMTQAIHPVI